MKQKTTAAFLVALVAGLSAMKAVPNCGPDLKPGAVLSQEEILRQKLAKIQPFVTRKAGKAKVEWAGIREWIRAKSIELKENESRLYELTVSIYRNGEEVVKNLAFTTAEYTFLKEPVGQVDYYILYKRGDQIVHISEFALKETSDGQNILPDSFTKAYAGELMNFELTPELQKSGVRPELTTTSVDLGKKKIVWILSPEAKPDLRAFIKSAQKGVDVKANFGANGTPESVTVTDRSTGRTAPAADPKDFFFKVDAAFNGNSFFWDDMLVALATVPHHPWLAKSTIDFWLMVQERNGGTIPREVRKENLISLWFADVIKYGEKPKPNLTFTNPYLMNWVMTELFNYDPSDANLELMKKVSVSVEKYAAWMEQNRAVRDGDGKLIGFNGSTLGSGADNSRGRLGNAYEDKAYNTGFVDFIAQQAAMYKDLMSWNQILYHRAKSYEEGQVYQKKSLEAVGKYTRLKNLLNQKYWNQEQGFYFDLVPSENGGWRQATEFTPIGGFWALYAGAPTRAMVDRLIEMQMGADGFGGDFPFPANARRTIREDHPTDPLYIPRVGFVNEDGYWDKWAHWPPMMMVAVEGFRRSGRTDVAFDMAAKILKKIAEHSVTTVEESYGEIALAGPRGTIIYKPRALQHATHPHRADFAGWGKGPPIYMLLNHFFGLTPMSNPGSIIWDARALKNIGEGFSIKNFIYQGVTVSELSIVRTGEKSFEVTGKSAKPFTLTLFQGDYLNHAKIGPAGGTQRVEIK